FDRQIVPASHGGRVEGVAGPVADHRLDAVRFQHRVADALGLERIGGSENLDPIHGYSVGQTGIFAHHLYQESVDLIHEMLYCMVTDGGAVAVLSFMRVEALE